MAEKAEVETFQRWVRASRDEAHHNPQGYLISYEGLLVMDESSVKMTRETFDRILRYCGRYDGTFPTGQYLGKMFIRGESLWWIGINPEKPFTHIAWRHRKVVIVDER